MAVLTSPDDRQRRHATLGVIGGMGVTLGTQAGAFLIKRDFGDVALASAAVYLCLAIWNMLVLPTLSTSIAPNAARERLDRIWRDRPFVRFQAIGIGYYFVMSQFSLAFTLAATDIAGSRSVVAWIYLVNTGITIALGYLLPRWLERWGSSIDLVAWGTFVAGAGLCIVAFSSFVGRVLIAAGVFSLGSIISRPGMDTVVANLADPAARGAYFGVAQLSLAIGGAAGYLVGGAAYDFGIAHNKTHLPWIGFFLVATITAVAYWLGRTSLSQVREMAVTSSTPTHGRHLHAPVESASS